MALSQIGEVAERLGLSLRTIRYYEEVGVVTPSARSQGGFRLYSEADVERLVLVKWMKPLDFTLDQMREVLDALDALEDPAVPADRRAQLVERLEMFRLAAEERSANLRNQLRIAEEFAADLKQRIAAGQGRADVAAPVGGPEAP
jgi:DNA-binding transcriptional MerR regulator